MRFKNCRYDHFELAEKFLEMAEKFLPYAANEHNVLDMGESFVKEHTCGTAACHGGYAAIILAGGTHNTYYVRGAHALACFFGFGYPEQLEEWADLNPSIWGNTKGLDMFCSASAFGMHYNHQSLTHVVKHYLLVAKNLMEIKE